MIMVFIFEMNPPPPLSRIFIVPGSFYPTAEIPRRSSLAAAPVLLGYRRPVINVYIPHLSFQEQVAPNEQLPDGII